MPWNTPGQNDRPSDPWGRNNKNQSPPDLDKLIADFFRKIRFMFSKKGGPSHPVFFKNSIGWPTMIFVCLFLLVVWFVSGLFIVNPAEEAVVLRFGRYIQTLQPGLHWVAPFIETQYIINAQKIYSFSIEGDFLTKSSDQDDLPKGVVSVVKGEETSSDQSKNLVNLELTVMYRINNSRAYLFSFMNPDQTIHDVAVAALSQVVGTMKLDDVLTTGRELLASNVLTRIREVLIQYKMGIEVTSVTLKRAQAPDEVRDAFNDVNRAEQDRKTSINKAETYASKIIPVANGIAARTLADANAYRQQVVLHARAEVARYQAYQQAYTLAPEVTMDRMYLDSMQTILQKTSKILLDTPSGNMLYLPLNQLPAFSSSLKKSLIPSDNLGEMK